NEEELREAVKVIVSEFKQQALVERFIRGREFCVGLLGNGDPEAFPVLEIDLEGDPEAIQSAGDKMQKPRGKICPARLSPEKTAEMIRLSKQAFNALGLRDFSRVDIRMDENENIYLLEINSMASLGMTGSYVYAAAAAGCDYPALVNRILEVASVRYFSQEDFFAEDRVSGKTGKVPLPVRIRTYLRGRQEQTEKLLSKMVNINNHTKSIEGVNTINRIIAGELKPLGFSEHIYPEVSTGNTVLFSNTLDENFDVLFVGFSDSPVTFKKHRPCSFTQHKIYGSGCWEGKGGLAVLASALKALRFTKLLKKIKVGVLLTPDNTIYGSHSAARIESIASKSEYILGLSGSDLKGSVILSRSGAGLFECEVHLIKPEISKDAAEAAMYFTRLLAEISSVSNEEKGLLVSPSDISIDSHFSPPFVHCEAKISIRFNSLDLARQAEDILRRAASKIKNKKVRVQIRGGIKRPPLFESRQSLELYSKLKEIASSLDLRTIKEHRWSSSNICFTPQGKSVIDGLGPIGTDSKEENEYILRHSLLDRAALLAVLMNEIRKIKAS
ncbi:MAG TPA: M20/M25/M40 family metallo-hydrolase, partial [Firmicutes bacterium]|nr:M20/M25/M40 family metallo-hydrolase [Bacillota bacterium]